MPLCWQWACVGLLGAVLAAANARAQEHLDLTTLLAQWRSQSSDSCEQPGKRPEEQAVFSAVADAVQQALNEANPPLPEARAKAALEKAQRLSGELNAGWPDEARLHFELIPLEPAMLIKLSFGTHAQWFLFGIPASSAHQPDKRWRQVAEGDVALFHPSPRLLYRLYPLHRGPSGAVRFLAAADFFGCAGSLGVNYQVVSWAPSFSSESIEVNQVGAFGMDEDADGQGPTQKDPFHPIGKLRTSGTRLTLPYCWFSALDWWDNPNLCAEDTYDLRGDDSAFIVRRFNRPELVPLAKAYEYAKAHDLPAMLGYFASRSLARRFLRNPPDLNLASGPQVHWEGPRRALVRLEDSVLFTVEQRSGRWIITAFRPL